MAASLRRKLKSARKMVNDRWRSARESRKKEEKVGGKNNKERWKEYKRENK